MGVARATFRVTGPAATIHRSPRWSVIVNGTPQATLIADLSTVANFVWHRARQTVLRLSPPPAETAAFLALARGGAPFRANAKLRRQEQFGSVIPDAVGQRRCGLREQEVVSRGNQQPLEREWIGFAGIHPIISSAARSSSMTGIRL